MSVQQSKTRFVDKLNKKTDSVSLLTITSISGKRARCSSSPDMQEEKETQAGNIKSHLYNISLE